MASTRPPAATNPGSASPTAWALQNRHIYSVRLHPDGTLFCSITGKRSGRNFSPGSRLWRSRDGGFSWECLTADLDLRWAGNFDFDPANSNFIYLTAASIPGKSQGGLYMTKDAGKTWTQLVGDGMPPQKRLPARLSRYARTFFVKVHPRSPRRIYLGATTHGLFLSEGGGQSWCEIRGIPFTACQRVTFDPGDHGTIWVATLGGGVWKGPAGGL